MAITLSREVAESVQGPQVVLSWTDTDAAPAAGYGVSRGEMLGGQTAVPLTQLATTDDLFYFDALLVPQTGDQWIYQVENADAGTKAFVTLPYEFGVVDPLVSSIRYTTLDTVKPFLNIPVTTTEKDAILTQTIISVEVAIDQHLGRSFPDPTLGEIEGIPEPIKQVATSASVAAYINITGPFGTSGSDDWFGSQDVGIGELVRREVARNPLLMGYQVSWGMA